MLGIFEVVSNGVAEIGDVMVSGRGDVDVVSVLCEKITLQNMTKMQTHACKLPFCKSVVNEGVFIVGLKSLVNVVMLDESCGVTVLSDDDFTVVGNGYELVGAGVEGHEVG